MMSVAVSMSHKTSSIERMVGNMLHVLPHTCHLHMHSIHIIDEVSNVEIRPLDKVKPSLPDLINGGPHLYLLYMNVPK